MFPDFWARFVRGQHRSSTFNTLKLAYHRASGGGFLEGALAPPLSQAMDRERQRTGTRGKEADAGSQYAWRGEPRSRAGYTWCACLRLPTLIARALSTDRRCPLFRRQRRCRRLHASVCADGFHVVVEVCVRILPDVAVVAHCCPLGPVPAPRSRSGLLKRLWFEGDRGGLRGDFPLLLCLHTVFHELHRHSPKRRRPAEQEAMCLSNNLGHLLF